VDEEGSSYKVAATMRLIDELHLDYEEVIALGCVEGVPQFDVLGLTLLEKTEDMSKENLETLWV